MVVNQGMGKKLRDQVFHVDEGMMLDRLVHERGYEVIAVSLGPSNAVQEYPLDGPPVGTKIYSTTVSIG